MTTEIQHRAPTTLMAAAGLAAWFGVTTFCQHPERMFDGLRRYDRVGALIPNWRFFAPEPAQHDFHVLHRVLMADGEQTEWQLTSTIAARSWKDWIWFPARRQEQALFDICSDLIMHMSLRTRDLTDTSGFIMLKGLVRRIVLAQYAETAVPSGFQFVIARYTGYDEDNDPEYVLVSAFVPLHADAAA